MRRHNKPGAGVPAIRAPELAHAEIVGDDQDDIGRRYSHVLTLDDSPESSISVLQLPDFGGSRRGHGTKLLEPKIGQAVHVRWPMTAQHAARQPASAEQHRVTADADQD